MFWKKKKQVSPTIAEVARAFANGEKEFTKSYRGPFRYEREDGTQLYYKVPDHLYDSEHQFNGGRPIVQIKFPLPKDGMVIDDTTLIGDYGYYPLTDDERMLFDEAFEARQEMIIRHREEERERILQRVSKKTGSRDNKY
jgi:hypothetical protein